MFVLAAAVPSGPPAPAAAAAVDEPIPTWMVNYLLLAMVALVGVVAIQAGVGGGGG